MAHGRPPADEPTEFAGGTIRTPFKRHRYRQKLPQQQKAVNRAHARIRAIGERTNATLKDWRVLTKLRCCPRRATAIIQAILVLPGIEADRHTGWKRFTFRAPEPHFLNAHHDGLQPTQLEVV
jgi:hypothetical protein